MASSRDWRNSLTASQRYENIQALTRAVAARGLRQSAFAIEDYAYKCAASREAYDVACRSLSGGGPADTSAPPEDAPQEPLGSAPESGDTDEPRTRIGQYYDCHYVASGVTAEVYRSQAKAFKVIVETKNIEPHNPFLEARILKLLQKPCIPLLETFRDQEQRFVLVFPYMPLTLASLLEQGPLFAVQIRRIFRDLFTALSQIHSQGIIHRDIKPSAVLLASPEGPAYLSDFGTAWHPSLSSAAEPADSKLLDIGTGPYRAPEVLFGNKSYGPPVDMWGAGAMLAECCRSPPKPLFESRGVHEDGNQLGLILSIFKTIGSPTRESWPEAVAFKTPPFDMYRAFDHRPWDVVLPDVAPDWCDLVAALVKFGSSRASADQALQYTCLSGEEGSTAD
ncbi:kinase-like domain-containing protein [Lasiosphaeria miniovina]|uniref:cyclin-dependent kinase n=1 Tax=Lasiosphaeria miniovina TaxID=1954250 RepID=A0AA39ZR38_9PEZI|nr:kinase-like domain-containing protein [Lasiosphaeria miniovina]KAK0702083.1 kinase-like domain-containing protein [Lasiosphaeria miniovina]